MLYPKLQKNKFSKLKLETLGLSWIVNKFSKLKKFIRKDIDIVLMQIFQRKGKS